MYEGEEKYEDFFEMPNFLWDDINHIDFLLSPIRDENTPTKDCEEYISDGLCNRATPSRGLEEEGESLQAKRRRQLFTSEEGVTTKDQEQISSSSENSWGEAPSSDYFNQSQGSDNLQNHFIPSDDRVDVIASSCAQHTRQFGSAEQQTSLLASCKVYKGKRSSMKTPMKLTTSIAYPFSPIKPCEAHGQVTLKNINHLIQSPSISRFNCKIDEDPPIDYSPISGKPVIIKTKIHTEGGKGSITIMRTKG